MMDLELSYGKGNTKNHYKIARINKHTEYQQQAKLMDTDD